MRLPKVRDPPQKIHFSLLEYWIEAMQEDIWKDFVAGLSAGALTTTILHPLDLLKTRSQVSHFPQPFISSVRRMWRDVGSSISGTHTSSAKNSLAFDDTFFVVFWARRL